MSAWCKLLLKDSGINVDNYSSHSPRVAASSYAKSHGASLPRIIRSAGWTLEKAFGWFSNKKIHEKLEFQKYLLNKE